MLVPPDQFSISVWDDVILLARADAAGEPLYLMPIDRATAAVLGARLLELAGPDVGKNDADTAGRHRDGRDSASAPAG
jgi:hypothetical protein